jgi:hypothetical protein
MMGIISSIKTFLLLMFDIQILGSTEKQEINL